jgi:hypothetical protein
MYAFYMHQLLKCRSRGGSMGSATPNAGTVAGVNLGTLGPDSKVVLVESS